MPIEYAHGKAREEEIMAGNQGDATDRWRVPGRFQVSPFNYREEVLSAYSFPSRMTFQDGTIRKIGHTAGTRELSPGDKVEIARLLDDIGVQEILIAPGLYQGTVRHELVIEGMRALCQAGLRLKVRAVPSRTEWVDGDYSYMDMIADSGVDGIDVSVGGPSLFGESGSATTPGMEKAVAKALEHVRSRGLEAGVSFSTIGRLDLEDTSRLANLWVDHGAQHYKLTDHFSELGPEAVRFVIAGLRKRLKKDVPLLFHAHDSFGMATACALAACSAGAWPETAVNGFGDNGFASFEEVVLSLEMLYGVNTGIKLEKLSELCRAVAEITGFKVHPLKSVLGEAVWVPARDVQYKELLDGAGCVSLYISPYEPAVVGARMNYLWSINSLSPLSVKVKLDRMGLNYQEEDVAAIFEALLERLRAVADAPYFRRDEEVEEICQSYVAACKQ